MTFEGFDAAPLIEAAGLRPVLMEIAEPEGVTLDAALRDAARMERATARAEATMLDLWIDRPGGGNLRALELPALGAGTSSHAWALAVDDGIVLNDSGEGAKDNPLRAAYGDEEKEEEVVVKGTRPKTVDDDSDWAYFWSGGGAGGYDSGDQGGLGVAGTAEAALVTTGAEGSDADIWVKASADIGNLSAEMKATFAKIVAVFKALGLPHPVITSGNDGRHGSDSLHYENQAIDLRGNNISDAQGQALEDSLRTQLGSNYDVVFETFPNDPSNDHLHIEFDPD